MRWPPPWIQTITGAPPFAFLGAPFGAKTLSCRQSSDVGPLAPPEFGVPSAFIGCGHEGPASAAGLGAVQGFTGRGGAQRSSPTGGAAKGMFLKTAALSVATPTTGPESIFTVTACAWAAPAASTAAATRVEIRII